MSSISSLHGKGASNSHYEKFESVSLDIDAGARLDAFGPVTDPNLFYLPSCKYTPTRTVFKRSDQEDRFMSSLAKHTLPRLSPRLPKVCAASLTSSCLSALITPSLGSYNKIFLLEFANASREIARIPSSIVGNTHLSTCSEVATTQNRELVLQSPKLQDRPLFEQRR